MSVGRSSTLVQTEMPQQLMDGLSLNVMSPLDEL